MARGNGGHPIIIIHERDYPQTRAKLSPNHNRTPTVRTNYCRPQGSHGPERKTCPRSHRTLLANWTRTQAPTPGLSSSIHVTLCHALCPQKEIRVSPRPQVAASLAGGWGRRQTQTLGTQVASGQGGRTHQYHKGEDKDVPYLRRGGRDHF